MFLAFVAAVAIAFTNKNTKDKINEHVTAAKEISLKNVLSEGSVVVMDSIAEIGNFWFEKNADGATVGYVFIGSAKGYSSVIEFFCGIDTNGKIKGLSIINQNETPGLGARVTEVVSDSRFPMGLFQKREKSNPWFCEQYKGISATDQIIPEKVGEWHSLSEDNREKLLKANKITTITGSTITTMAITRELSSKSKKLIFEVRKHSNEKVEIVNETDNETEMENTND
jgi:RnfABCDGE-type electron transport complex G subunit